MHYPDFKKILEKDQRLEVSNDLISAVFVFFSIGAFVLVEFLFGFNLVLWVISMLIGAMLCIAYPRAGLYALILLTVIFERFFTLSAVVLGRNEIKLYPIDILLVAVIIGTLFSILQGKIAYRWRKTDFFMVVFVLLIMGYLAASLLLARSIPSVAFSSAKQYGFYSLFYFVTAALISSKKQLKELGAVVFLGGIAIIWFIAYGIFNGQGLWSEFTPLSTEGVRTLAFPHGYYLCMTFIVGLVYLAHKRTVFSQSLAVLLVLWAIGIFGSMMRHLWVSLLFATSALSIFFARDNRNRLRAYGKKYILVLLFSSVFVLYSVSLFPGSSLHTSMMHTAGALGGRATSLVNASEDESFAWRSAVWQQASKAYLQSPVLGIGFGKIVPVEIGSYHDFVEVRNMHNSFLAILVQMGLLGSLIFFCIIAITVSSIVQKNILDTDFRIGAYAGISILIFQITAFLFQPYLETNLLGIFFWINLGMVKKIGE